MRFDLLDVMFFPAQMSKLAPRQHFTTDKGTSVLSSGVCPGQRKPPFSVILISVL